MSGARGSGKVLLLLSHARRKPVRWFGRRAGAFFADANRARGNKKNNAPGKTEQRPGTWVPEAQGYATSHVSRLQYAAARNTNLYSNNLLRRRGEKTNTPGTGWFGYSSHDTPGVVSARASDTNVLCFSVAALFLGLSDASIAPPSPPLASAPLFQPLRLLLPLPSLGRHELLHPGLLGLQSLVLQVESSGPAPCACVNGV